MLDYSLGDREVHVSFIFGFEEVPEEYATVPLEQLGDREVGDMEGEKAVTCNKFRSASGSHRILCQ